MSFSYLSIVKEIINVFQAGLLAEKLKSDIDNGIHDESMTNDETDVIKMVLANEDFFNRVEVKMAQDFHDIIWENYYNINKKKRFIFIFFVIYMYIFCD